MQMIDWNKKTLTNQISKAEKEKNANDWLKKNPHIATYQNGQRKKDEWLIEKKSSQIKLLKWTKKRMQMIVTSIQFNSQCTERFIFLFTSKEVDFVTILPPEIEKNCV